MARPQPRPVTRHPLAPRDPQPAEVPTPLPEPEGGAVDPARSPARPGEKKPRSGKQLGLRVPVDLYERLVACADETGIPQSTLVRRALDKELRAHQH